MSELTAANVKGEAPGEPASPLTEEDFYYDGPSLVFTAAYHRKRGFCCGNGCRHCPYPASSKPSAPAID